MNSTSQRADLIASTDLTQPPADLAVTSLYFRIDRRHISFLRFILEAYEGIAVVTTLDPEVGAIKVVVAPGSEEIVTELLEDLRFRQGMMMEPLAGYRPTAQGAA